MMRDQDKWIHEQIKIKYIQIKREHAKMDACS